jgi:hypothetical protein
MVLHYGTGLVHPAGLGIGDADRAPATLDARGRRQRERTIRSPGFAKIIVSPAAMTKRKTILDRSDIRLVCTP